jgi:hypothetical protein
MIDRITGEPLGAAAVEASRQLREARRRLSAAPGGERPRYETYVVRPGQSIEEAAKEAT